MTDKNIECYDYWRSFYDQLDAWMKEDAATEMEEIQQILGVDFKEWNRRYYLLKNATVKKHISSTHTWIKGKMHYSKKADNWHQSPLECKVCGMGASGWERECVYFSEEESKIKPGELPSGDMHGGYIYRTCEEVLKAKKEIRKKRKGTKCLQCGTYGCKGV